MFFFFCSKGSGIRWDLWASFRAPQIELLKTWSNLPKLFPKCKFWAIRKVRPVNLGLHVQLRKSQQLSPKMKKKISIVDPKKKSQPITKLMIESKKNSWFVSNKLNEFVYVRIPLLFFFFGTNAPKKITYWLNCL